MKPLQVLQLWTYDCIASTLSKPRSQVLHSLDVYIHSTYTRTFWDHLNVLLWDTQGLHSIQAVCNKPRDIQSFLSCRMESSALRAFRAACTIQNTKCKRNWVSTCIMCWSMSVASVISGSLSKAKSNKRDQEGTLSYSDMTICALPS